MMVDLMVMEKGKGKEINLLPFGPCDGIKVSRWWQPILVLIPRGLMHNGGCVRHLDGVLFVVGCFSDIAFGLYLFDPLSVKRDGEPLEP